MGLNHALKPKLPIVNYISILILGSLIGLLTLNKYFIITFFVILLSVLFLLLFKKRKPVFICLILVNLFFEPLLPIPINFANTNIEIISLLFTAFMLLEVKSFLVIFKQVKGFSFIFVFTILLMTISIYFSMDKFASIDGSLNVLTFLFLIVYSYNAFQSKEAIVKFLKNTKVLLVFVLLLKWIFIFASPEMNINKNIFGSLLDIIIPFKISILILIPM